MHLPTLLEPPNTESPKVVLPTFSCEPDDTTAYCEAQDQDPIGEWTNFSS